MATSHTTVLGEGYLEVDFPERRYDPKAYRWDDIVALFHRGDNSGTDIEFPADLAGRRGTLFAVVTRQPRELNKPDHVIRRNAVTPPKGSEVVLGTGTVILRDRTINGFAPGHYANNAIGVLPRLNGDVVRSLMSQWVRLELRG